MTFAELRQKYHDFKERFFKAGTLKKQLANIDECLKEMNDPFVFEITIYPFGTDRAVTFEIDLPERDMCEHIRGAMGQFKLIHLKKLEQLGVTER
jgi:hypothetical protein